VKRWLGLLWLGCAILSFACANHEDSSTILHSITTIMAVAADIMDRDKGECSIDRILPVRHPRRLESNNYESRRSGEELARTDHH
jgi:hypothetical protein